MSTQDRNLSYQFFRDVSLDDPFFDSLKNDYKEFYQWFLKKANEKAYVFYNHENKIDGFLYLKIENEAVNDVTPKLPIANRLKLGTFKINPHGTRLGERFIKKVFDHAFTVGVTEIYVTIFEKHGALIKLFEKYGFEWVSNKTTANGTERVYLKSLSKYVNDVVLDYPLVNLKNNRCFLLALYPIWHTRLLPDSILKNEHSSIVQDISHTNSIHKVYLTDMRGTNTLKRGDILIVYRTTDHKGAAFHRSVITSLCVVEEIRFIDDFNNLNDFVKYCSPYSVFSNQELIEFYARKKYRVIIRFTYNMALPRRITRGQLINNIGLSQDYWGFFPIEAGQLKSIIQLSGINENFIIY